jgi:hypothetical protein
LWGGKGRGRGAKSRQGAKSRGRGAKSRQGAKSRGLYVYVKFAGGGYVKSREGGLAAPVPSAQGSSGPFPTAATSRECEVGKFQKAVGFLTPKVFEVRSPYQKPVISYPWIL